METFIIFGKGGVEFYNNIFVCHKLGMHVAVFWVVTPHNHVLCPQLSFH
jgi:hypothetical protein